MSDKQPKNGKGPSVVSEADFNDAIAQNRALPIMNPDAVPEPPPGYRPTDPEVRIRRLRRFPADLRSEAVLALIELAGKDLKQDLGKFAPDAQRTGELAKRVQAAGKLTERLELVAQYGREVEQIALSDALVFLENVNKHLGRAIEEDPTLRTKYSSVVNLFAQRSMAIAEGMARARAAAATTEEDDGEGDAAAAPPAPERPVVVNAKG